MKDPEDFKRGPEEESGFTSSKGLGSWPMILVGAMFILIVIGTTVLAYWLRGADTRFTPDRPVPTWNQPAESGDSPPAEPGGNG